MYRIVKLLYEARNWALDTFDNAPFNYSDGTFIKAAIEEM